MSPIALSIADAVTNAGARVLMARSLADAFIAIEAEVPSAVILDHALTDGESSQLCQRLKESDTSLHEQFMFCDMGAAQFWIEPADLAKGRFDKAWGTTDGG